MVRPVRAAIFTRAGEIVCVATTDRPAGFPTGGELVEERDASGALIPMQRRDLMLEDAGGGPPGRFIAAAELRGALELDGAGRARIRGNAAAELRALRLVELPGPAAEPAGGAASMQLAALDNHHEPTPPGWRDRLGAWWHGTTVAVLLLLWSLPAAAEPFADNAPALKSALRAALAELLARPALHTGNGDPPAALGFAGDAWLDLATGAIWTADQAGAWTRRGELWLDVPAGPPPLPPAPPSL